MEFQPFLIICDMNMPLMNGMELFVEIEKDKALKKKCIPFVFLSGAANEADVQKAYEIGAQGFFKKLISIEDTSKLLHLLFNYWSVSKHPNNC